MIRLLPYILCALVGLAVASIAIPGPACLTCRERRPDRGRPLCCECDVATSGCEVTA
jgi:hypothetical protein